MSYQNAVRSAPAARRTPSPRQVSHALSTATHGSEPSDPVFDQVLLERLGAMLQALKSAPDLDQAIRLPEVLGIVGISKSSWYARLNPRSPTHDTRVPRPFKLGRSPNSPSVWWRSAVVAYLNACADAQASS